MTDHQMRQKAAALSSAAALGKRQSVRQLHEHSMPHESKSRHSKKMLGASAPTSSEL